MLKLIRNFVLIVALCHSGNGLLGQNDTTLHVSDFVYEIQQIQDANSRLYLSFWMPWQYWETAMLAGNKGKPLPEDVRELVNEMKRYTIVGVVEANVTPYGYYYTQEKLIKDSLLLVINDSIELHPLEESLLNENIRLLLGLIRPTMTQMLGPLGQNMYFFVFANENADGNYYIDGAQEGQFTIRWHNDRTFNWRLPLDILVPPKFCPVDGEELSGKFKFCPYHGDQLISQPK